MHWLPHPPLDRRLRRWVTAGGSLTAHLQRACRQVTVQRLHQGASPMRRDEAHALRRERQRRAHAREVVLRCDAEPVVYARSVVAAHRVHGPWRALAGLGSRPLAQLLFQQPHIARSPLAYARVPRCGPLRRHIAAAWQAATDSPLPPAGLWARRSLFTKQRAPLWLMEVFSPRLAERRAPLRRRPGAAAG
ncbi:chorismate--pyruvate lyase family protein [Eleftheria terrae]|uniref:chorismate--pyruvate lyase family protein n=1 Tax=Eleftheria terrae TaxID=1597781 RepID=UPI00263B37DE|nr:chorismate lyase [Eleftheria terrae]WKB53536.1 chorismate lyase [Eleftheria terrae]